LTGTQGCWMDLPLSHPQPNHQPCTILPPHLSMVQKTIVTLGMRTPEGFPEGHSGTRPAAGASK
jgi:hypothetical protein